MLPLRASGYGVQWLFGRSSTSDSTLFTILAIEGSCVIYKLCCKMSLTFALKISRRMSLLRSWGNGFSIPPRTRGTSELKFWSRSTWHRSRPFNPPALSFTNGSRRPTIGLRGLFRSLRQRDQAWQRPFQDPCLGAHLSSGEAVGRHLASPHRPDPHQGTGTVEGACPARGALLEAD